MKNNNNKDVTNLVWPQCFIPDLWSLVIATFTLYF